MPAIVVANPHFVVQYPQVMCRRAAQELSADTLVNLGLGIPERVAIVLNEHRQISNITLTAEAGVIGGVPSNKLRFGAAYNPDIMLPTATLFDLYDGGGAIGQLEAHRGPDSVIICAFPFHLITCAWPRCASHCHSPPCGTVSDLACFCPPPLPLPSGHSDQRSRAPPGGCPAVAR